MLVDTFVNAIFLYDDKLEITFNFKEDTVQATFGDLQASVEKEQTGSDMKSNAAPKKIRTSFGLDFLFLTTL